MTAADLDDGSLKPYLTWSLTLHLAGAAVVLALGRAASVKNTPVYMIDFVGPTASVIDSRSAGGLQAPAAAAPRPQTQADEFSTARRKGAPLPRPSLLRGWRQTAAPEPAAAPQAEAPAPAGASGEAGVATDLPDFPYPWYISQLRQSLWSQWSARMPGEKGECVVVFCLLPGGQAVDLRVEESSGDSAFDLAAMGAVQDAAPFPPLPRGFQEPFLKIHVALKTL
ncbi:MAG: energy transducer TonB [Elusimicrobia bacterium]|nr:energy transducer TonB [Elusimicrobiota bacterium]